VGDRLDTDIAGAVRAGMDSLLVLSGVSGPAELLAAPPGLRPTFVAADVTALFAPEESARVPVQDADGAGGWRLERDGQRVRLDGSGEPVDAVRLLTGPCWDGVAVADVQAASAAAREVLTGWIRQR
jgi:hypothetical protein